MFVLNQAKWKFEKLFKNCEYIYLTMNTSMPLNDGCAVFKDRYSTVFLKNFNKLYFKKNIRIATITYQNGGNMLGVFI